MKHRINFTKINTWRNVVYLGTFLQVYNYAK